MWTRCINASDAIVHPVIYIPVRQSFAGGKLRLEWFAEAGDILEETDQLGAAAMWHPSSAVVTIDKEDGVAVVTINKNIKSRFFRVRKN